MTLSMQWRVGALRKHGLDPDEFCQTSPVGCRSRFTRRPHDEPPRPGPTGHPPPAQGPVRSCLTGPRVREDVDVARMGHRPADGGGSS